MQLAMRLMKIDKSVRLIKKTSVLVSLMAMPFLSCAFAAPTKSSDTSINVAQTDKPMIVLHAFAKHDNNYQPLGSTVVSRSQPNHHICWLAGNLPKTSADKRIIQEIFVTPKPMQFVDSQAQISTKGTTASVVLTAPAINDWYDRCWQFDSNDPTGAYSISVMIDNIVFDPVYFTVLP